MGVGATATAGGAEEAAAAAPPAGTIAGEEELEEESDIGLRRRGDRCRAPACCVTGGHRVGECACALDGAAFSCGAAVRGGGCARTNTEPGAAAAAKGSSRREAPGAVELLVEAPASRWTKSTLLRPGDSGAMERAGPAREEGDRGPASRELPNDDGSAAWRVALGE